MVVIMIVKLNSNFNTRSVVENEEVDDDDENDYYYYKSQETTVFHGRQKLTSTMKQRPEKFKFVALYSFIMSLLKSG